jgi:chromosome segregation ATPase
MPQRANVRSVDAIEAFRSQLVVYLSQARPALDEISAEVVRTRLWLENEQRLQLEHQLLRRRKQLEEAQQALFSSRLGILKKETAVEQMAVHKAKRALEETEGKLRVLKKWVHEFDTRVQPLLKQVEKLQTVLTNDMTQALAYLSQTIQTLSAYAEVYAAPESSAPSTPASDAETSKGKDL